MNYDEILGELCAISGPSGFEGAVASRVADYLRPWMDEVHIDRMGSVVGIRHAETQGAKTILLDAHLDEIGFLITGIEEGFLRFRTLGGVDSRMLPDRELTIMTQPPIYGVVACLPPHIQSSADYDKSIPVKELYLDVGLSQAEAERRIPIGTPATYRSGCTPLGEKYLCGKAMDDRSCVAILLDTMERLKGEKLDVNVIVLGSVQEEVSSLGAITATYGLMPDCCIAVDVTHGRTPDGQKELTFPLGKGPTIGVGPNCTKWMSKRLFEKAKTLELGVQTEVLSGHSGTNGWPMQICREGVATAVLSLPLRYMHTPLEVCSRQDMIDVATLLVSFVQGLGEEVLNR